MNYLRYHGLELEIYDPEQTYYERERLHEPATQGYPNFLRLVATTGPNESLKTRLDRSEMFFQMISALCELQIVDHSFGLCPDIFGSEVHKYRQLGADIVPRGFLLAANVTSIAQEAEELPRSIQHRIKKGIETFEAETAGLPYQYKDLGLHQIIYGHRVGEPHETDQGWYVDIEPRIGNRNIVVNNVAAEEVHNIKIKRTFYEHAKKYFTDEQE